MKHQGAIRVAAVARMLVLSSSIAMLAACGGGGSSGSDSDDSVGGTEVTISGTAAAGAPIIGQVTVKDARGVMRTTDIRADGSYSVNVSGLTAPFVFRAQGQVGGRQVILTSAATSADVNGTINITPFTDLVVANMAGQIASQYFDNPDFAQLTEAELNEAKTMLTQRLLPVLGSLGIAEGFDLLRTAFRADHSGIDAVLDVIRVTVDAETNTAIIRDIINNTQISDDLTSQTDSSVIEAPTTPLLGAVTDLQAIEAQLNTLNGLFATSMPSPLNPVLLGLFAMDGSFLHSGYDVESFVGDLTSDPEMLGSALVSPTILQYVDANTIHVGFAFKEADGSMEVALDGDNAFVMKKVDGAWRIAGNHRPIGIDADAINLRRLPSSHPYGAWWLESIAYERKLEFWIDYAPAGIDYVRVSGPGLKLGGEYSSLMFHRSAESVANFVPLDSNGLDTGGGWISECGEVGAEQPCIDFSVIGDNAEYTVEVLDADQQPIEGKPAFVTLLPKPPVSNAVAQANAASWFASFSSITPGDYSVLEDGVNIHVSLVMPTASGYWVDDVSYEVWSESGVTRVESEVLAADGRSVDMTWSGPAPGSNPILHVWVRDLNERYFITSGEHRSTAL